MDPQAIDLAKRAGRAALPYAGGVALAYLFIGLIPCVGPCVNFFLSLGAFVGIAYLITPKMTYFPPGQSRTMHALYIGAGVAVVVTAGFIVASLVGGLLGMALSTAISSFDSNQSVFGAAVGGLLGLILSLVVVTLWGLFAGTGLAMLGSYLAFNRMPQQSQQDMMRPF
jgi:hypothetical protein